MSYRGSLVSIDLDTSELEQRLERIDEKLNDLGGEDILDEDRVQSIIDNGGYVTGDDLDGRDYVDESRVDQIVRDLMHSEGNNFVQDVIDDGSYVTEDEVDEKIRDAVTDITPDEDAVRTIVESVTDGRLHRLEERVDALETRAEAVALRTTALEMRTREYDSELADLSVLAERVASLTEQVKAQDATIDMLDARTSGGGELGQALTFFSLLKQAFAALR